MMKKIVCLVLCMMMVLPLFSCKKTDQTDDGSDTTVNTSGDNGGAGSREDISDDLPAVTFGGADFVILAPKYLSKNVIPEEGLGEAVDEKLFQRNAIIEDRFDVTIVTQTVDEYRDVIAALDTDVMAEATSQYSLVDSHVVSIGQQAVKGNFMNWYDVPNINFSKPWWSTSNVEDLTFNNTCFIAIGDFNFSSITNTYCYYYNKELAKQYQIGDLEAVVENGGWTIEYLSETVKNIWTDKTGDGPTKDDFYGLTTAPYSVANAYFWGFGEKIVKTTASGMPEVVFGDNNDKMTNIVDKLYNLMHQNPGVDSYRGLETDGSDAIHQSGYNAFMKQQCLLAPETFSRAKYFTMMGVEFGILPYPKYDENQAEYKTMVDGSHGCVTVPLNVGNKEMTGVITEALNAETYKKVVPEYYDVQLKIKYQSDASGAEMVDRIYAGRVFDAGYVYGGFSGGYSFVLQSLVGVRKSRDFASYYAEIKPAADGRYNDFIALYSGTVNE